MVGADCSEDDLIKSGNEVSHYVSSEASSTDFLVGEAQKEYNNRFHFILVEEKWHQTCN